MFGFRSLLNVLHGARRKQTPARMAPRQRAPILEGSEVREERTACNGSVESPLLVLALDNRVATPRVVATGPLESDKAPQANGAVQAGKAEAASQSSISIHVGGSLTSVTVGDCLYDSLQDIEASIVRKGNRMVATAVVDSSGQVYFLMDTWSPGTRSLSCSYSDDADFLNVILGPLVVIV
jgi:hypothetical protein